jgi:hypothetical protein
MVLFHYSLLVKRIRPGIHRDDHLGSSLKIVWRLANAHRCVVAGCTCYHSENRTFEKKTGLERIFFQFCSCHLAHAAHQVEAADKHRSGTEGPKGALRKERVAADSGALPLLGRGRIPRPD